ncbi:MAG: hypothetical protein ACFFFB_16905, partial [Candidatus Heimdallarchaeota archaeon]
LLNGESLPGPPLYWRWMENFVINMKVLFGEQITSFELLIFCLIISVIAIFVLFDGYGFIWNKIKS